MIKIIKICTLSATIFTPLEHCTWVSGPVEATMTSAPALRNTSITMTASISSLPSAIGTNTFFDADAMITDFRSNEWFLLVDDGVRNALGTGVLKPERANEIIRNE